MFIMQRCDTNRMPTVIICFVFISLYIVIYSLVYKFLTTSFGDKMNFTVDGYLHSNNLNNMV